MNAKVKKWSSSAAAQVPAPVVLGARLDVDEGVELRDEAGRIVIETVRKKEHELRKLLKGITSKNQHHAVDFGPAMGKEGWRGSPMSE